MKNEVCMKIIAFIIFKLRSYTFIYCQYLSHAIDTYIKFLIFMIDVDINFMKINKLYFNFFLLIIFLHYISISVRKVMLFIKIQIAQLLVFTYFLKPTSY